MNFLFLFALQYPCRMALNVFHSPGGCWSCCCWCSSLTSVLCRQGVCRSTGLAASRTAFCDTVVKDVVRLQGGSGVRLSWFVKNKKWDFALIFYQRQSEMLASSCFGNWPRELYNLFPYDSYQSTWCSVCAAPPAGSQHTKPLFPLCLLPQLWRPASLRQGMLTFQVKDHFRPL